MVDEKTTMAPNESAIPPLKVKGKKRNTDTTLGWVERDYPQLGTWRTLAVEWVKGETTGLAKRLNALVAFLERYLVQRGLPLDPAVLLACTTTLPDFYRVACPDSEEGIK